MNRFWSRPENQRALRDRAMDRSSLLEHLGHADDHSCCRNGPPLERVGTCGHCDRPLREHDGLKCPPPIYAMDTRPTPTVEKWCSRGNHHVAESKWIPYEGQRRYGHCIAEPEGDQLYAEMLRDDELDADEIRDLHDDDEWKRYRDAGYDETELRRLAGDR